MTADAAANEQVQAVSGTKVPVVVIGAGPYGLAAAAHLAGLGIGVRCFGEPMAGWSQHMPKGMFLKSTAPASSIGCPRPGFTIGDYCDAAGLGRFDRDGGEIPIPIADFVAYGLWFQQRVVPDVERVEVTRVAARDGGFEVGPAGGEEFLARAVVVAAGTAPFAYIPEELSALERGSRLSHSSEHDDLSGFAGERVIVVGAGQSALESAVLLHESGAEVELIARRPRLSWNPTPSATPPGLATKLRRPWSPLGSGWPLFAVWRFAGEFRHLPDETRLRLVRTVLGPAGAWWLKERLTSEITTHVGCRLVAGRRNGDEVEVEFVDGDGRRTVARADHVLAATGYHVDVHRLGFLAPDLADAVTTLTDAPRLSATFESSTPGLFFTGLAAATTFGPLLRFVAGSDFAARRVATGVAARCKAALR